MNRSLKRIALGCVLSVSTVSLGTAIYPRVYAFNTSSQGVLIASNRAANCRIITPAVSPNLIPTDAKSGRPLVSGTAVCDWNGNTGQINGTGAIDFVKQGDTAAITKTLIRRGFKPS